MKVLWIINIAIPKIAAAADIREFPVGGWMVKLADELARRVELSIAFPFKKKIVGETDGITYYTFHVDKGDENAIGCGKSGKQIRGIIEICKPDVVHIHGTEYVHSYIATEVCKDLHMVDKLVISIQGLTSICSRHYEAYLPNNIVEGKTLRDIYAGNVKAGKRRFQEAGFYEAKALKCVKHVIGRTDWDKACIHIINPNAEYHFCNEMLRDSFYEHMWSIEMCEKHSIFMSQAIMPIKGLHLALEALTYIKCDYPDTKLYIAGKSYYAKPKWKLSYYEKYILNYIDSHNLHDSVAFTGFLDEQAMCQRYLKSHVFVSASSVENSPNSVCEAMILGMPVVSSMVGGVSNLLKHGEEGYYYQADAPYMLAHYVETVFSDEEKAVHFGKCARRSALIRHDIKNIIENITDIYNRII